MDWIQSVSNTGDKASQSANDISVDIIGDPPSSKVLNFEVRNLSFQAQSRAFFL